MYFSFPNLLAIGCLLISNLACADYDGLTYDAREDVKAFVAEMVQQHGFEHESLINAFAQTRFQPSVIKAITPPVNPIKVRSWERYKPRFVNNIRISRGQQFMQTYAQDLKRAREQFGVPEEVIAAIIGVETVYGSNTGNYRIMDALTTLAFDYPRRADYFKEELVQYLLLTREQSLDYFSMLGSYAGAIGLPQFMPTNVRTLAVDFDGDGVIDLRNNPVDAIGSVAKYLQHYGWQANAPIAKPIQFKAEVPTALTESILPALTVADIQAYDFVVDEPVTHEQNFALLPLETPNRATEYWLGFNNFYVITRYNKSTFYAMSVLQLAQAIKPRTP